MLDAATAWIESERRKVETYLNGALIAYGTVAEWPVFHVLPYVAIWRVGSKACSIDLAGWAISGDGPTDYVSSPAIDHPRKAMAHFSRQWAEAAASLALGEDHPAIRIGWRADWPTLVPLLTARSELLAECASDDALWSEVEQRDIKPSLVRPAKLPHR